VHGSERSASSAANPGAVKVTTPYQKKQNLKF
jgi:hypothetical protein